MTRARILADYVAGGTTAAEFNYMDGVTSNVQTQLDAKLALAGGTMTGDLVPATPMSHRNMIINGAMTVAQRRTSASNNQPGILTCDHFKIEADGMSADFTCTQDSTGPDGFKKSLKLTHNSGDAMGTASDQVGVSIRNEAQYLQHLCYGTSSAKTTTLSFYVKTNLAGTYAVNLKQSDNSDKINAQSYVVSSSDASSENWVRYSITIPGDTSGVINDDNGDGMNIGFALGAGSNYRGGTNGTSWQTYNANLFANQTVNVFASSSSYWQITGIQWELGSSATPFEHRSYGDELQRCQRYYEKSVGQTRMWPIMENSSTDGYRRGIVWFSTTMRTTPPTITTVFSTGGSTGTQNESSRSFTPYRNGVASTAEENLASWTAEAEL